ncbi:MAG TPA: hypothetical protein VFI11_13410 [Anaerolineales bacterium]|nr:hypothetical protein [Anaerolineales bacterium]
MSVLNLSIRRVVLLGLVLLSAGCANVPAATSTASLAPEASPTAETQPSSTLPPLEASPTSAPCFTREELAATALDEIAAWPEICFESSDGVHTTIDQTRALEAIHAFLQEDVAPIGFREITLMGNSPNGQLRVARFEDGSGRSFLVAVTANRVLEMMPGPTLPAVQGPRLSQLELETLALELITRELPEFPEMRSRLASTAGVKSGELYFFRYEYPEGGPWTSLPPLAQVGLTEDGQVFSYLNTLYFVV